MREGQPQFTAVQLPAFNLEETRAYLRYRLSAAGHQQDDARALPFSNRQIERIHKLSGGIPAAINARASEMLGDVGLDLMELLPRLPADLPRPYVYGTAGVLVLVVLVALVLGGDDSPELAQSNLSEPVPIPLEPVPAIRTVVETRDQAPGDIAPQTDAPVAGLATGIPVADGVTPPAADPEPVTAPAVSDGNSVPAPLAAAAATPTSTSTPAASTPAPAAAPARPAAAASASDPTAPLASQHTRIRALPANQFTVQLLGSTSRANVEDLVRRHASSPLYWFETRNQGNPWFVIMMGAYPSRSAAQTAASALTGELGRLEPWIRSIGTVQAEIVGGN
jgi:DamX protein